MNKQNLKLLNDFANTSVLSTHIRVDITEYCKSYKPREVNSSAYYEDCILLAEMVSGAEHFLYFLERNRYEIKKKKK